MKYLYGTLYPYHEERNEDLPVESESLMIWLKEDEFAKLQQTVIRLGHISYYPMMSYMLSHSFLFPSDYPVFTRIMLIDGRTQGNQMMLKAYGTLLLPIQIEIDRIIRHLQRPGMTKTDRHVIYLLRNMRFFMLRFYQHESSPGKPR